MSEPITISGIRIQNKINSESYWNINNITPLPGEIVFYLPDYGSSNKQIRFKVGTDGHTSLRCRL